MRPSTTKLGKILHELGVVDKPFTANDLKKGEGPRNVGDETYGRESFLYIGVESPEERKRIERILRRKYDVTTVSGSYSPGGRTIEVGVTYFKGWHHN